MCPQAETWVLMQVIWWAWEKIGFARLKGALQLMKVFVNDKDRKKSAVVQVLVSFRQTS